MKLKKLIGGTILALTLALGAGAGLSLKAQQVDATGGNKTDHALYVAVKLSTVESTDYSDFNVRINTKMDTGDNTWVQATAVNIGDTTTIADSTIFAGTYSELWDGIKILQIQLYDGDTQLEQHEVVNSNWDTTDRTGYLYNYEADEWITTYTPPVITYRTITKLAVEFVNGEAQEPADWDIAADSVVDGVKYNVPGAVTKHLEHFDGWYTDTTCETPYIAQKITADLTLYGKFVRLSVDSYFYWTDKDSTALTNVYFWGEYAPVAWPGVAVSNYLVSDVLSYRDQGKLYKIPCPSTGDFKVILNGDGQTGDIVVTPKCLVYTYNSDGWGYSVVDGAAADLVARIETARNAVSASGSILKYSVCGIAPSDAQAFYNEYYAMDADTKSGVDSSCTYTYEGSYDGEHVPTETNIYFYHIMLSLKKIAEDAGLEVSGSSGRIVLNPNNNVSLDSTGLIAIVSVIALVSISSVAVLLIIKKRKHN